MEKIKNIRKKLRHQRSVRRRKLGLSTPTQIICVSFIIVIALGTLLLTLPIASRHGRLDVLNAMFTATSATCVTGLVVRDTWSQFTWFGQAVVLLLIQVGGLGLVTLTSFFALAMRRRMGFRDLRLLGESVSADGYDQAKSVLKIVVGLAAMFEGIGILLLMFAFVPQFGLEGVWISVFTAISAFCNAGFDLFGRFGAYSSLVPYVNNYYVQAVIMFMIISGGLGFMVWVELCQWYQKRRLSLHAKVVLSFSVILWLGGALGLGLNLNPGWINFYVATDVLLTKKSAQWIPIKQGRMNFNLGIGVPMGKRGLRQRDCIRVNAACCPSQEPLTEQQELRIREQQLREQASATSEQIEEATERSEKAIRKAERRAAKAERKARKAAERAQQEGDTASVVRAAADLLAVRY